MKKVVEVNTKADSPFYFTVTQTLSGGGPNYWLTTFTPNFGAFDIDPGNVVLKVLGPEEYGNFLMEKAERYVHVMRPDLSRAPESYIQANKDMWTPKPKPAAKPSAKPAPKETAKPAQ